MPKRVTIIHPVSAPWVARMIDGIHRFAEEHGGWHIYCVPPSAYGTESSVTDLRAMRGWKGDGILIATNEPKELEYAREWGIPTVNLAAGMEQTCGIPRVIVDHYQTGRVAAAHLLERGLTHLAYYGWKGLWYSEQRLLGLKELAAESGAEFRALLIPWNAEAERSWSQRISLLKEWLSTLPLPCGILAVHDFRAQLLMEACDDAGLRVPDDIAVVGIDDNETICEHSIPKLTSVSRNPTLVGYKAAAYLNRLMEGEPHPDGNVLIPPAGVVVRDSSDMMYASDPLVRQAIEYMRKNIRKNYNVEAVADHLEVSKRKLERSFASAVDNSPHQYLIKLRILHAQTLMKLDPKKTVETVAAECGFSASPTFYAAFQRVVGQSPAAFRDSVHRDFG